MMWDSIVVRNYLVADKSGDGHPTLVWDNVYTVWTSGKGYFAHEYHWDNQNVTISVILKIIANISYPGFIIIVSTRTPRCPVIGNG